MWTLHVNLKNLASEYFLTVSNMTAPISVKDWQKQEAAANNGGLRVDAAVSAVSSGLHISLLKETRAKGSLCSFGRVKLNTASHCGSQGTDVHLVSLFALIGSIALLPN